MTGNGQTQRTGFIASTAALAAVIALGVWFFLGHKDDFSRILDINFKSFSLLSLLCIIAVAVSGVKINAVLHIFRTRLSIWEGFGLSALNTMANFYFTKAGIVAKGIYLKKQHRFPYAHFLSSSAGAFVITLVAQGMLGLVLALCYVHGGGLIPEIIGAFAALTVGGLMPFLFPSIRFERKGRVLGRVARVIEGWEHLKKHRKFLFLLGFLDLCYVAIGALRLYVSYNALGYSVGLLPCFIIAPLSTLTAIVSITPGAVGIRQAIVGYTSSLLDIGLAEGVTASTVDHAVGTIWVFCFGLIFGGWIWRRWGLAPVEDLEGGER